MVVVLMGPAGSGKTTVGRALATALRWTFLDGDNAHTPESVARMQRGEALTEPERDAWLARLHAAIEEALERRGHLVVACSALKERHRAALRGALKRVRFVYLKASPELLAARLAARHGHFAGPALLPSQLASLEEPSDALTLDASLEVDRLVAHIRRELGC